MSRGALLSLILLFAAFGGAWWWQSRTADPLPAASGSEAGSTRSRLELRVGGDLPLLEIPAAVPPPPSDDSSPPPPFPGPDSAPPAGTWVRLRRGETIHGLCLRIYGDASRLAEVLEANGLTEERARTLRPGARIFLPR